MCVLHHLLYLSEKREVIGGNDAGGAAGKSMPVNK
jgi:hypothetical protein